MRRKNSARTQAPSGSARIRSPLPKAAKRHTVRTLFAGRPGAKSLFAAVRAYVKSLGPVKVQAAKTQISFGRHTRFAWIWLPQLWIKKRKANSITLAFGLRRRIRHRRIEAAVEPRPGRWTHHVVIERISDFDQLVRTWIREAYESAQERSR